MRLGIISSIIMPGEAVSRRASYVVQFTFATTLDFSPFGSFSIPGVAIVVYAIPYLLVRLALASYRFQERDL